MLIISLIGELIKDERTLMKSLMKTERSSLKEEIVPVFNHIPGLFTKQCKCSQHTHMQALNNSALID